MLHRRHARSEAPGEDSGEDFEAYKGDEFLMKYNLADGNAYTDMGRANLMWCRAEDPVYDTQHRVITEWSASEE